MPLDADSYLTIQLLSYDRPTAMTERFYFLEMSTLQATILLSQDKKIVSAKIVAYTNEKKYLDEIVTVSFETIGDFNDFFINNPDYYIHNCDIKLENGINIGSHDDGEVLIEFPIDNSNSIIIENIFDRYSLDKKIIHTLKSKPGHYIAIDRQNMITGDFKNFDDYIKKGRK
ncbi:hypothetical protein [Foetidibacter luteolus]|uniref:hypothetical protein n=1 Tax=Foetidibacter luteolus TaxID=2608880 RepID=UPI00129BC556|nr:hypothetical protein [Foetidibacter luteolus]